jgi:hypothetical protein
MNEPEMTEDKNEKKKSWYSHQGHSIQNMQSQEDLPWRAWGSWFSWGSPVGMGIGWALFLVSIGVFLVLLHQAGILH